MTHLNVCHDPFTRVPWLIYTCTVTNSYVPWLAYMCAMIRSHVCHDSFIRAPWRIHMCAMTKPYVPWLNHTCHDMQIRWRTNIMPRHDSFTRASKINSITWHICIQCKCVVVYQKTIIGFFCKRALLQTCHRTHMMATGNTNPAHSYEASVPRHASTSQFWYPNFEDMALLQKRPIFWGAY